MERIALKSKFGNIKLNNRGYYQVSSRDKGFHKKMFHRLIWEDFYGCEIPKGYVIHHKNGNKQDNCILNLQLMRNEDHARMHTKLSPKTPHSDETKLKISKSQNTSGYFRVYKNSAKKYKQGFAWSYHYYEGGKRKAIYSTTLDGLKEKVIKRGLIWKKLN